MEKEHLEIIHVLEASVKELKKGILEYNNFVKSNPNIESKSFLEKAMTDMHKIAIKLNVGIEGLKELEELKQRLTQNSKQ